MLEGYIMVEIRILNVKENILHVVSNCHIYFEERLSLTQHKPNHEELIYGQKV